MKYNKELILKLTSEGYNIPQIHKLTTYPIKNLQRWYNKRSIKVNKYPLIFPQDDLIQLTYGSILGDGYLSRIEGDFKSSRLSITHSPTQIDYLLHKKFILDKYGFALDITSYTFISKFYMSNGKDGTYTHNSLKSLCHPFFTYYRKLFYGEDNIKYINEDIRNLGPQGLAIWFMDDGQLCSSSYQINTQSFNEKDFEILHSMLEDNFNIKSTHDKNNVLYIRVESKEIFADIIYPYIIPSMMYKIRQEYHDKLKSKIKK